MRLKHFFISSFQIILGIGIVPIILLAFSKVFPGIILFIPLLALILPSMLLGGSIYFWQKPNTRYFALGLIISLFIILYYVWKLFTAPVFP